MKKKQIIGLVIAAVIFAAVGVVSALTNSAIKNCTQSLQGEVGGLINGTASTAPDTDYVGVLSVEGTIGDTANTSTGQTIAGSMLDYVQQYTADPNCRGILLYIDSPGGAVYETDEVYLALENYKEQTGNPVYAYGGSMIASGAYYIACAADEITVNRNCWVGSIGVYMQAVNYADLFDKLGVEGVYIKTGENKAMGNAFDHLTDEQKAIYQGLVDDAYEQFLGVVMNGRGYDRETLLPIADGRVYTAAQGMENGLIDGVEDNYDAYTEKILSECGAYALYTPTQSQSLLDQLFSKLAEVTPKSDTQAAQEIVDESESGVLMYRAEF